MNALTGCDQHQKLGESADGAYSYYLSSNAKGDAGLEAELENIEVTLKDMVNMEEGLSFFSALPQTEQMVALSLDTISTVMFSFSNV